MSVSPILELQPLGFPWATTDPFLFCAHHDDAYPKGNGAMGPAAPLTGRDIGQDFSRKDGWSMYHGDTVPGFPAHPHRGFETVTLVRKGLIDHCDSMGATARFGGGDVQWVTAGSGIVHSEMFPLLKTDDGNPLELFQIWLNLPARSKLAQPHFTMLWKDQIPRVVVKDAAGRITEILVVAGSLGDVKAPGPPPSSWAADEKSDVAIWTIRMDAEATFRLPPAQLAGTRRTLYLFKGDSAQIAGQLVSGPTAIVLDASVEVRITAGAAVTEFLLLQGQPIGEPVAQYGPFVMNSQAEIIQAMNDYRRTQFGGWSFGNAAPVHGSEPTRFAKYPDGRTEVPAG